jgi:hypothetical protein
MGMGQNKTALRLTHGENLKKIDLLLSVQMLPGNWGHFF